MSEKKQKLLDALLESVKECQIRFGGKSELATEGENVIAKLCARFEDICNHGLKRTSEPASSLNSLKDKVVIHILHKHRLVIFHKYLLFFFVKKKYFLT